MKKILTEASTIANAYARTVVFSPRNEEVYFYPGSVSGIHLWLEGAMSFSTMASEC